MSDSWINRLVVSGPDKDVRLFATTATDRRILREQGRQPWEGSRRYGISFGALLRSLPSESLPKKEPEIEEPWEVCVDGPDRIEGKGTTIVYLFQLSRYEPDQLLEVVSSRHPRLCFVLGWVSPDNDEQASIYFHKGQARRHELPPARKAELTANIPEEEAGTDDEILWALIEADWAMLDAVVAFWDRRVATALRRIARDDAPPVKRTARRKGRAAG